MLSDARREVDKHLRFEAWDERLVCSKCVHVCRLQLCLPVCNSLDCTPSGSSVHGILQAYWSGLPWPPQGSSLPGDRTYISMSPVLAGMLFTTSTIGKPTVLWIYPMTVLRKSHIEHEWIKLILFLELEKCFYYMWCRMMDLQPNISIRFWKLILS